MQINELFQGMAKHNASDLHLKSGQPPIFRISGELVRLKGEVLTNAQLQDMLLPLLNDKQRRDLEERGYADFAVPVPGIGRFRCNLFKQMGSLAMCARRNKPTVPTYADLGLPPQIERLAAIEQGLVLIGGITGSGKSTTIASVLNDINSRRRCHILTIEDPIEFVYTEDKAIINQREIGQDVASFDDALRSAMREDPDVMLLGEMRDGETVETALSAAETGHLVFGTIHASSAPQTIGRLLDLFPAAKHAQMRTSMAFNLKCIMNQKLLPAAQGKGMVPAVETMFISPIVRKLILDGEDAKLAETLARDVEAGSENFNKVLTRLYKEKKVSMEVALAASPNPEELRMSMRGISISS
jgi:twitching motility protein PilT